MNNKILNLIIITLFLFCLPMTVNASFDAIINGDTVRIRKGPGTSYDAIKTVNTGTPIVVLDKTLYEGDGCSKKWLKVNYKDKEGYVCSKYVTYKENIYEGINIIDWTARVNGNNVSVRKEANKNSTKVDTLTLGANVTILKEVSGGTSGCSGGKWYQIKYYGESTGYICKIYVTKKADEMATDETYAQTLKEANFPDSYIPYLTYLHNKYPNWVFKAGVTNLDFATSVNAESGKCYMQTTNDNYRTSSKPAEGSSWFKVNSGVIAFYMDPRNWLNEERIFMFEKLDYATELEPDYPALVKSVFGSGKLSDDAYTIPIFNAGKTNSVSPVHIASRIKLEVSANGSASTDGGEFTWKGEKYSGFYNFFNIGAYEQTIDGVEYSAVTRGLAYAAKLINRDGELWNNIQTAITEGSSFLANGYVNKGQGTLYYQKFNTGPDAYFSTYTHQYMTNIQAPAIEGSSSYESYKDGGLLNQTFIFEIPVYKNMPDFTSLPNSGDTNNYLKSLEVSGYTITPSFDKDILSYESFVPNTLEKVTINAISESDKATITGAGENEIQENENDITITVKSETGEERKYTITINKVESTINTEQVLKDSALSINSDKYINKIANGTKASSIINTLTSKGASKITIKDAKGNVISDSSILATNYTVTLETALDTKTLTISVKGDTSGDGKITILDLLQIQKHIKGANKLSGATLLSGDTSGDNAVTILDLLQVQKYLKGDKKL